MNHDHKQFIKTEWEERQKRMGNTPRAVLFKRLPGWANALIHRNHVRFILRNLPPSCTQVLDLGCGYGRIARALISARPELKFTGVELCSAFADEYRANCGKCHNMAIQDFEPEENYDAVLFVTVLMYVQPDETQDQILKFWKKLNPGGRLILIEPAAEQFNYWKRITGKKDASPTGGDIQNFTRETIQHYLSKLPDGELIFNGVQGLIPVLNEPPLYRIASVEKHAH